MEQTPVNNQTKKEVSKGISFSYVNTIAMAKSVARSWQHNHSSYTLSGLSISDLQQKTQELEILVQQSRHITQQKSENTAVLAQINKAIDEATAALKNYIKAEYVGEDIHRLYEIYGMKKPHKKLPHQLPIENDERGFSMRAIIEQLSKSGHPFANRKFGLQYWQTLNTQHQQEWEKSRDMRSDKTVLVRQTKPLLAAVKKLLSKLKQHIRLDFDGRDVDAILREFGFLKELA